MSTQALNQRHTCPCSSATVNLSCPLPIQCHPSLQIHSPVEANLCLCHCPPWASDLQSVSFPKSDLPTLPPQEPSNSCTSTRQSSNQVLKTPKSPASLHHSQPRPCQLPPLFQAFIVTVPHCQHQNTDSGPFCLPVLVSVILPTYYPVSSRVFGHQPTPCPANLLPWACVLFPASSH